VSLVLSIFPGLGILDHAFELEGFTTVRGPDVIFGGDIRTFHPPPGRFDGVIGGDPCQSHSSLANLVRAKGLEPSFPDMTPEFQRVVEEARPAWFLRENVPKAPDVKPAGYDVRTFLFDNWASLGEEQQRRRRFWFGVREGECPELRKFIKYALEIPGDPIQAVTHRPDAVPVKLGGSGKVKRTAVQGGHDATPGNRWKKQAVAAMCDGHRTDKVGNCVARYTLAEMLELQGLPPTFLDHCPFTVQGKRKAIGNGVAVPTGRALARAIRLALVASSSTGGSSIPESDVTMRRDNGTGDATNMRHTAAICGGQAVHSIETGTCGSKLLAAACL